MFNSNLPNNNFQSYFREMLKFQRNQTYLNDNQSNRARLRRSQGRRSGMAWRRIRNPCEFGGSPPPSAVLEKRAEEYVAVYSAFPASSLSNVGEGSDDDGWLEISEHSNWNIIFSAALSSGGVLDPYFTVAMRRIYHPIKIDSRAQIAPCLPRSSSSHEWGAFLSSITGREENK